MSYITYHEVSNEAQDLFDRLKEEGVIHEGKLYSPRKHDYVSFKYVFDYRMCDMETINELKERTEKDNKWYKKQLDEDKYLTQEEKEYQYMENLKCDPYMMPVYKSQNGGVYWTLNYGHDDLPSVAIGRKYPEEVFEYFQETEGHVDSNVKYKGDKDIENLLVKMEKEGKDLTPELKKHGLQVIEIKM